MGGGGHDVLRRRPCRQCRLDGMDTEAAQMGHVHEHALHMPRRERRWPPHSSRCSATLAFEAGPKAWDCEKMVELQQESGADCVGGPAGGV